MKSLRLLVAIAAFCGMLSNCSKSVDSKSKSFSYPLALGNQWTYSGVQTLEYGTPVKTDTLWIYMIKNHRYYADTMNLTVTQVDTIRPGVFSHTIRGVDLPVERFYVDVYPERKYLNLPQGMYLLSITPGHYATAEYMLPRRIPQPPDAIVGDRILAQYPGDHWLAAAFPDRDGLIDCQAADPADTLPLIFPYPQHTGLFWNYRDSTDSHPYRTDKVIEGRETITTAAGTFNCWRIRYIWPFYSGVQRYVEYVAPEGLIRRRNEFRSSDTAWAYTCDLISYTLH